MEIAASEYRIRRLLCHEPHAFLPAAHAGLRVHPDDLPELIRVDRSPTGSATAARTALLAAELADATWRNESIIGTWFDARVLGHVPEGVLTEVTGTAFCTGEHRFVLDPRDTVGTGFVLR